jgi:hypothetical protein
LLLPPQPAAANASANAASGKTNQSLLNFMLPSWVLDAKRQYRHA